MPRYSNKIEESYRFQKMYDFGNVKLQTKWPGKAKKT